MAEDWLGHLKVGDRVVVCDSLPEVTRLTKTQVHTKRAKYNRRTGRQVGQRDGWHTVYIHEATSAEVERVEHLSLARTLSVVDWRSLPLKMVRTICRMVSKTR